MLSHPDALGNFIDTINDGPDRLHPALFDGPQDRVLLGLKAHANTISHARLIALEETFPLTRHEMGGAAFNTVSRAFVETSEARAMASNDLGKAFAAYLQSHPVGSTIADLAAIEWAWLESYHAAEAVSIGPADLSQCAEAELIETRVVLHPSVRVAGIHAPLASALDRLAGEQPHAIMTVRPESEVRLVPLDRVQAALLAGAARENATLGNLLALALEQASEQAPFEPILYLVGAGALVKAG